MASLADPSGPFSSLCTAARPLPSEKIGAPSPISEGSGGGGCTQGGRSGANVFNNVPLKLSLFTFNIRVSIVCRELDKTIG